MIHFAHLHVHSHYSLLDGVARVPDLVKRAKALGMEHLALTDHGNMFGAVEFYQAAKEEGIHPVLGLEAYVAPGARTDKSADAGESCYHLILLAETFAGYQNLSRLSSMAFLNGFHHKPRIDKEALAAHSQGLICSSACLRGEVNQHLLHGRAAEAEAAALTFKDIFGPDRFFLEVMRDGLPEQERIIEPLRTLAKKTGLSLLPTADVHYVREGEEELQDILRRIGAGRRLADDTRPRARPGRHLKSPGEMARAFPGVEWREALERTVEVARRCRVDLPLSGFHLPTPALPDGLTAPEYFDRLCREGLARRYGEPLPREVVDRYEMENSVIRRMGFVDYFLVMWDIVDFARANGIGVGPGRGSAAGSIVAYALGITNLDPLRYGLLFERFLNGRVEMPDIDLDFEHGRRHEIVNHLIDTYGADRCAKIITFDKISLASGIRDVGRVLRTRPAEVNRLIDMLPYLPRIDKNEGDQSILDAALRESPDFKAAYKAGGDAKRLIDYAARLDGVVRQTGIHAAGVLVSDRPITDYGPLAARDGEVTTQYAMDDLTAFGLCKIDVLGLDALTLLRKTADNVAAATGQRFDLDHFPMDDAETFAILARGDTEGVFQFASPGFRGLLKKMRPDRFADLMAAVAMYRPGPMCYIDTYIARKHGREPVRHLHPLLGDILDETHGLAIYQEQVAALAQKLAGFSLAEGEFMRRAMGAKKTSEVDSYRAKFIAGAAPKVGEDIAARVFEFIEPFAAYGFNKSHSACYALIAYQTAYLKCHHPREYMAALLTTNASNTARIATYREVARRMGIPLLPPSVNESGASFTVVGDAIRYGLAAVKGVGEKAAEGLVVERERNGRFTSLLNLCERVDLRLLDKVALDALIKAGAFDEFDDRARQSAYLEMILSVGLRDSAGGQVGEAGASPASIESPSLPCVPPWPDRTQLQFEKEVLGFYMSSHPLAAHADDLRRFATDDSATLVEKSDRAQVRLGGLVTAIRFGKSNKSKPYASVTLEDPAGTVQVMIFDDAGIRDPSTGACRRPVGGRGRPHREPLLDRVRPLLEIDRLVFVTGEVDRRRDEPLIVAKNVLAIEEAEATHGRSDPTPSEQ